MPCVDFFDGNSQIHKLDPRLRIIISFLFSLIIAFSSRFSVLFIGLGIVIVSLLMARLPLFPTLKRILPINLFMLLLVLILPFSIKGIPLFSIGPIHFSREGLFLALHIALKGNIILMGLIIFLGTIEMVTLGHALHHLRIPLKLTHLFLFTVRYIDVLHHEYHRIVRAMKARGFKPKMNMHTYKTFANLVGMLLINSLERSERILAAMKCRGFKGRFYLLNHFTFSRRDVLFGSIYTCLILILIWMEWL